METSVGLSSHLAPWLAGRRRSLLRRLVNVSTRPGLTSLAGGLPAVELFPAARYGAILTELLADPGSAQYGARSEAMKERAACLLRRRGVECRPEEIVITTGAQQALDIVVRAFVGRGDAVAVERSIYTGFREALAAVGPTQVVLPSDLRTGLDVDALKERLERGLRLKLLYVIPDAHNPLGVSLPVVARRRLVELAHAHDFVILEDDPYGLLCVDGEFEPPLAALDAERVLHVGTLSKLLAPALRLGFLRAPRSLVDTLDAVKEAGDLECSRLTTLAAARLLGELDLESHLDVLRATYRRRRDAMVAALEDFLPEGCDFSRPGGGMFAWVELPDGIDGGKLLERCLAEHEVVFVPAEAFAASGCSGLYGNAARLSFSTLAPEAMRPAVAAFAAGVAEAINRPTEDPA